MAKVLVLDDEISIRGFIVVNLESNGLEVVEAATGEEALRIARTQPDIQVALLDVMLPGIDGIEVCQELRRLYPAMGIIMLTAKEQEQDKVTGLEAGADDYVVKPFSPNELIARVNALLRRVALVEQVSSSSEELICEPFVLCVSEYRLYKGETSIAMTPTELAVMEALLKRSGKAVSRDELLDIVWGPDYFGDPKIVDVNIRRIRMKIEDDASHPVFIETVWGHGYRWRGEPLA